MSFANVLILFFLLLVFWALGAYNRLERLRGKALWQWQTLHQRLDESAQAVLEQLGQHHAPGESTSFAQGSNAAAWEQLRQAAHQLQSSLRAHSLTQKRLLEGNHIASIATAYRVLHQSWSSLQQIQNDLAGAAVPPELLASWFSKADACAKQIKLHNNAVQNYQQAIEQFPALLIAWLFRFERSAALPGADERVGA